MSVLKPRDFRSFFAMASRLNKQAVLVALLMMSLLLVSGCGSESASPPDTKTDGKTDTKTAAPTGADGSKDAPLRVMLIPADTGADTTLDDFRPVFNAITRHHGLEFDLRVGPNYAAVVEAMAAGHIDIAFFGAVTLHQAQQRNAAELLAVSVKKGESSYYSVFLVEKDSDIEGLKDLQDKSLALGDSNSTSSFRYPVAMLLEEEIDPIQDLERIVITGSHSNAIAALKEGHVDAAACSLNAYEKARRAGVVGEDDFKIIKVSQAIPNMPLAMHPNLSPEVKQKLRNAFGTIHEADGVKPEMIRGYGGDVYDRYDVEFPQARFDEAMVVLQPVTEELVGAIVENVADKAGSN